MASKLTNCESMLLVLFDKPVGSSMYPKDLGDECNRNYGNFAGITRTNTVIRDLNSSTGQHYFAKADPESTPYRGRYKIRDRRKAYEKVDQLRDTFPWLQKKFTSDKPQLDAVDTRKTAQSQLNAEDDRSAATRTMASSKSKSEVYFEGQVRSRVSKLDYRNQTARMACLAFYGSYACQVCGFLFADEFPGIPAASKFIHVHHKNPFKRSKGRREVDPKTDLVPLCPNCHSMAHATDPPLTVNELRAARRPHPR